MRKYFKDELREFQDEWKLTIKKEQLSFCTNSNNYISEKKLQPCKNDNAATNTRIRKALDDHKNIKDKEAVVEKEV